MLTVMKLRPMTTSWLLLVPLVLGIACSPNAKQSTTAPTAQVAKPAHLTYALVGVTWSQVPIFVAQAKGFFTAENLTVDIPVAGQSAAACQQVLAKAAELGECSLNDMIQADQSGGAHLVTVMDESVTALQYGAMAKPNIKSWDDVKGKVVMVGGPKDNTVYYFHLMARAHGLKDSDYSFEYAGATPARFAALKSGAVDVSMLANPADVQAEQAGFVRLDNLIPKYLNGENYSGGGAVADAEWAKAHSDELSRYVAATIKAVAWTYDPANKQDLFKIVQPRLNLTQEAFDQVYQTTIVDSKEWSSDGSTTDPAVQGVIKGLVDLGALKEPLPPASKFYDLTYDRAAQKLAKQ